MIGVLTAVRRRVPLRVLLTGFCGLAGIGAAASINADEKGFFGTLSIASALVIVACMVVRFDATGGRLLARASHLIPAKRLDAKGSRLWAWAVRLWNATGPG